MSMNIKLQNRNNQWVLLVDCSWYSVPDFKSGIEIVAKIKEIEARANERAAFEWVYQKLQEITTPTWLKEVDNER